MAKIPTLTLSQLIDQLKKSRKEVGGSTEVLICVPFRNGIGMHYEGIKNISNHEGIVDIFTTTPTTDDIRDINKI